MVLHTKYSYLEMFTVISMRLFSLKYVQLLSTSLEGSSPHSRRGCTSYGYKGFKAENSYVFGVQDAEG